MFQFTIEENFKTIDTLNVYMKYGFNSSVFNPVINRKFVNTFQQQHHFPNPRNHQGLFPKIRDQQVFLRTQYNQPPYLKDICEVYVCKEKVI